MKKTIALFLATVLMLVCVNAFAEDVDLSQFNDDALVALLNSVQEELMARNIQKSADLPAGKYTAGVDIPAGSYIITCKTDDDHHGIVWVSAPTDNLNEQYPSILYEHVSFNKEEKFRVTIEEGGILNLPFAATITISVGVLFK